jgi:hypothetical protein
MNQHPHIAEQLLEARRNDALARAERSRLVAEARRQERGEQQAPRRHEPGCLTARPATS